MPDGSFVDCYIPQDSSWHREKLGEMYKYNPEIPFMPVAVRSIFTLTQYGIALSHEEYVAILIHDGWILEENRKFIFKEPTLAMVLQMADYIATKQEKNND